MTGHQAFVAWWIGGALCLAASLVTMSVSVHRGAKDVGEWAAGLIFACFVWPVPVALILGALPFWGAHELIGLIVKPRPAPVVDANLEAARREVDEIAPASRETP